MVGDGAPAATAAGESAFATQIATLGLPTQPLASYDGCRRGDGVVLGSEVVRDGGQVRTGLPGDHAGVIRSARGGFLTT